MPLPDERDKTREGVAIVKMSDTAGIERAFTSQECSVISTRLGQRLGPEYISQRAGPGGRKVPYITGEKCINLANQVFGFDGWSSSVQSVQTDFVDESSGKISLGLSAIVRITLKDGTYHEDIGYGEADNVRGKAAAFAKAKKTAITDGKKRALRNFGEIFNCISDPDYIKRIIRMKVPQRAFDETNLLRHPDFVTKTQSLKPTSKANLGGMTNTIAEIDETGGDDFGDLDDICIEDEEYEGLIDDESLLNLVPTPSKIAKDELKEQYETKRPEYGKIYGLSTKDQIALNHNGNSNKLQLGQTSNPRVLPPGQPVSKDVDTSINNETATLRPGKKQEIKRLPDALGSGSRDSHEFSSKMLHEAQKEQDLPPGAEIGQTATFFSARAALADAKPSETTVFDPYRQSPSIPRSAGFDHSKSTPIARNLVPLTTDALRSANTAGRQSFDSNAQPAAKSMPATPGSRGFRAPTMTGLQTPGQTPYPPLSAKRLADGNPAGTKSSGMITRSVLTDASRAQLNTQHNANVKIETASDYNLSENASKRTRI